MKKLLRKLFLNAEGEVSFTKFGAMVGGAALNVIMLYKLGIDIAPWIYQASVVIAVFSGSLTAVGARDALKDLKK